MKLRRTAWAVGIVASGAVVLGGAASCSSNTPAAVAVGTGCTLNSDCDNPLVCIYQTCHQECASDRDCNQPVGSFCIFQNGSGVCLTPAEQTCADSGTCKVTGTSCNSSDGQCHQNCSPTSGCATGDVCATVTVSGQPGSVCFETGSVPEGGVLVEAGGPTEGGSNEGGGSSSGGPSDGGGGGDSTVDAPLTGGILGFTPSNLGTVTFADGGIPLTPEGGTPILGADGGIDFSDAPTVTVSGNANQSSLPAPLTIVQSDGSLAHLYVMKQFTVDSSAVLAPTDQVPIILAVQGPVDIQGTISVSAYQYDGYAGATTWGGAGTAQGPGGGGNGFVQNYPASGGGGGTFCGVGGKGGASSGTPTPGGSTYGNATITPLTAGSGGGYVNGYQWGAGGGAIQISSGTSIRVRGVGIVTAGGGSAYGGGGSGGAIILEAPTLTIEGNVSANGGGGGAFCTNCTSEYGTGGEGNNTSAPGGTDGAGVQSGGAGAAGATTNGGDGNAGDGGGHFGGGGGGAGWIRLNSQSGKANITGTISPDLTTTCASQGTLH